MKTFFFLTLPALILLSGCSERDLTYRQKTANKTITAISDSIFFKQISEIKVNKDTVYILDYNRKKILKCNNKLNLLKIIGRRGKGPGEFLYPDHLMFSGNNIYVKDAGKFLVFKNELFQKNVGSFSSSFNSRFAIDKNQNIYLSTPDKKNTITVYDRDFNVINEFGNKSEFRRSTIQNHKMNEKHLFITNEGNLLAVNTCTPTIELFDTLGNLLFSDDINDILLNTRVEYAAEKQKKNPQMAVSLYNDVCFNNNKLYILLYDERKTATVLTSNKILKISISEDGIKIKDRYELNDSESKENYYTNIEHDNNGTLIAFDYLSASFQLFKDFD